MARKQTTKNSGTPTEKKTKFGLMAKMLLLTVVPIVVILITIGIILLYQVQVMLHDLKKDDIDAQGNAAALSVETYFSPYFTAAEMLAQNESIKSLSTNAYNSNTSSAFLKNQETMDATIEALANASSALGNGVSIFISVETNNQVMFSDGSYYDNSLGIDVNTRAWYQLAKENPNQSCVTAAYVDTVTGGLVVTVSRSLWTHWSRSSPPSPSVKPVILPCMTAPEQFSTTRTALCR